MVCDEFGHFDRITVEPRFLFVLIQLYRRPLAMSGKKLTQVEIKYE